jgi:NADH dehydrogenase
MTDRIVTVFGGTGFLGRRIVRHLRQRGFYVRIASRHSKKGEALFGTNDAQLQSVDANIHDERSIAEALAGAYGVVNAVSLYLEHDQETFQAVHVDAARRLAFLSRRAGLERFIHISGIGSNVASPSLYVRKRGAGERAVCAAFVDATIIRPAVMFAPDDAFLTTILRLLRRLPIYPLFGRGLTRLQPVYVEDVAAAIATTMRDAKQHAPIYECAGPRIYTYEGLLRAVAHEVGVRPIPIAIPFAAWRALAWFAEVLPSPPLTRNQVELMQIDTVPSPEIPGLRELGVSPRSIEEILQEMLSAG